MGGGNMQQVWDGGVRVPPRLCAVRVAQAHNPSCPQLPQDVAYTRAWHEHSLFGGSATPMHPCRRCPWAAVHEGGRERLYGPQMR